MANCPLMGTANPRGFAAFSGPSGSEGEVSCNASCAWYDSSLSKCVIFRISDSLQTIATRAIQMGRQS